MRRSIRLPYLSMRRMSSHRSPLQCRRHGKAGMGMGVHLATWAAQHAQACIPEGVAGAEVEGAAQNVLGEEIIILPEVLSRAAHGQGNC
jgi:hypothetical protein